MKITREYIYAVTPAASPKIVDDLVRDWPELSAKYGIVSAADTAHFLGQIAAETLGLNRLEENLFYTTTKRLRAVWPSRFKTDAAATPYVRNPQKLANLVYSGRLGNSAANDGWLYRGSGTPHLTGKANYAGFEARSGVRAVLSPDLVRVFPAALAAGLDFWKANNLARFVGNVTGLTKAWQGGKGALADRTTYTARALKASEARKMTSADGAVQIDLNVGTVTMSSQPIPTKPAMLRNGSKGDAVKQLQTMLGTRGYQPGYVDGVYGDGTERAVQDFQRDNGLVADGVAGPKTMAAIRANTAQAKPLPSQSGLNKFLAWLIGLFTRA